MGSLSGEPAPKALRMGKSAEVDKTVKRDLEGCGELTARNCLRMPLWLDSTGVRVPHTVQYRSRLPAAFKPSVCRYSAASRLDLVRAAASRETREEGPARVLLLLVDVGCLLQRADWRRRSIVTIHPHDAVLSRRVRKTFVMKMAKTDPCSCNAWRTCGTKSIASKERCSQSDRCARQIHPSVSVAFALLWTTWPSVTATQQSRIALKAIRFQKADQTRN